MMRQDYLLRMIEEFAQMIARIMRFRETDNPDEARELVAKSLEDLIGMGPDEAVKHSERELLVKCLESGPSLAARQKGLMLIALLCQEAELRVADGRLEEAARFHLKCLNLLLDIPPTPGVVDPAFAPRIEEMLIALGDEPLPVSTQAALMYHYERNGDLARAEDWLFRLRDATGSDASVIELGETFYRRLLDKSDEELVSGNLPRDEVITGQSDWTGQG